MRVPPQMEDVFEELSAVSSKWRLLGLQFQIGTARLDEIDTDKCDCKHKLLGVLEEWYRNAYPSWEMIVNVLRSNTVSDLMLASAIEAKHCCLSLRHYNTEAVARDGLETAPIVYDSEVDLYDVGTPAVPGCGWFHGNLSRDNASQLLQNCSTGTFLVRDSGTYRGNLTLSVKLDNHIHPIHHFLIKCANEKYWIHGTNKHFNSVQSLVCHYQQNSITSVGDWVLQTPFFKNRLCTSGVQYSYNTRCERPVMQDGSVVARYAPKKKPQQNLVPLTWRYHFELPVEMIRPHIVRIGSDIYFGGECGKEIAKAQIYKFSMVETQWCSVCDCPTRRFGLTELDGKLIAVGGMKMCAPSSDVYALDFKTKTWKERPCLVLPRADACTFAYNSNLITIGGIVHYTPPDLIESTSTIEILRKDSPSWTLANCMIPVPLYSLSFAIISETVYVLGGCSYMQVTADAFSIFLPPLVDSIADISLLPSCQFNGSTAAVVNDILLSIGGQSSASQCSSEVYAYSSSDHRWVKVPGDLPEPRYLATAVQLDANRTMLVGGCAKQGDVKKTAFVMNI